MNNRLKAMALRSVARMHLICEKEYPLGSARLLIWFEKAADFTTSQNLSYRTTPVICNSDLIDKVIRIENGTNFAWWGINPWTGEKADLQIQF